MKLGFLLSLVLVFCQPVIAEETSTSESSQPVSLPPVETQKSEDQIPVNLMNEKKTLTSESSNTRLFLSFGLMAVLLGLGYYFAKRYGKPTNSEQTKIKILTQHYLGPKKSLAIVRVAGESILIGVTDQNINMIKSLSLLDDEVPESVSSASFQQTFNEKKEMNVGPSESPTAPSSGEEFSIRHIKDVVSLKLKGMRNDL